MFKNIVFLVFSLSFEVRRGILGQNGAVDDVLTIQGRMVKFPFKTSVQNLENEHFPSVSPIFGYIFPKIGKKAFRD